METDLPAQTESRNDGGGGGGQPAERISDPFAVDLFASNSPARAPAAGQTRAAGAQSMQAAARRSLWHTRLPRVTLSQSRLSAELDAAVPSLSAGVLEAAARVVARYTRHEPDAVSLRLLDVREIDFASSLRGAGGKSPRAWVQLTVEPGGATVAAETEADFAARLVERVLGGDGAPPDALRALSPTELAVVEFIWLNLVREINEACAEPLWRLDGCAPAPPAWLTPRLDEDESGGDATDTAAPVPGGDSVEARGLLATTRVTAGGLSGLVRFYLAPPALAALAGARRDALLCGADDPARLAGFKRLAPDIALHPLLGRTEVTAAELSQLECGDVVVVARPLARREGGALSGRLEVRLGDGREGVLAGAVAAESFTEAGAGAGVAARPEAGTIKLLIETIRQGDSPLPTERFNMAEESEEGQEGGVDLDHLWLTVRVELASRRISLEELARLRVGQLLELGCKATDPVDLFSEGHRLARGELVDIEGQLGVRITQLAL